MAGDVTPAGWLVERLGGAFGAVTRTVPGGFPAYARILHPACGADAQPVTWAEVAAFTGHRTHALVQWRALVGLPDRGNISDVLWPDAPPEQGNLEIEPLAALCDLLSHHTTTPDEIFFCLWRGWAQLQGSPAVARLGSGEAVPPALTDDERRVRQVILPGREYYLMHGPLSATVDLARYRAGWRSQSPNLFWPADHAWCVASEIDFDSTLLGGSVNLINVVLQSPALEAWPIQPDDSLAADADLINPIPAHPAH